MTQLFRKVYVKCACTYKSENKYFVFLQEDIFVQLSLQQNLLQTPMMGLLRDPPFHRWSECRRSLQLQKPTLAISIAISLFHHQIVQYSIVDLDATP